MCDFEIVLKLHLLELHQNDRWGDSPEAACAKTVWYSRADLTQKAQGQENKAQSSISQHGVNFQFWSLLSGFHHYKESPKEQEVII